MPRFFILEECEKIKPMIHGRECDQGKGILSHPVVQVTKGAIAGTVAKTLVYPLDRLKTSFQVDGSRMGRFTVGRLVSNLVSVVYDEGLWGLWKGNFAAVARTLPSAGIAFYAYDIYNEKMPNLVPAMAPTARYLLAGGAAGVTATVITYPLDTWNTRKAIASGHASYGQLQHMATMAESRWGGGLRSCYRGLLPTLSGVLPYAGISFCTFTSLKKRTLAVTGHSHLSPVESVVCGGLAGIVSQTASYPIDTVRKRVQAHAVKYLEVPPSAWSIAKHLWISEGPRGFFNGVSLNWIKGFLAAGLSFAINEQLKQRSSPR